MAADYPHLEALYAALPRPLTVPQYRELSADEVPEPYHQLLVHDRHMTLAMGEYHHCRIAVRVLQSTRGKEWYARQIVLLPQGQERIVQGGVVRIHLHMLDLEVQRAILREDTPLGLILIDHEIMRRIEVTRFLRLEPGPAWAEWPGFPWERAAHARLGIIYCDGQPAIELCEIIPNMESETKRLEGNE